MRESSKSKQHSPSRRDHLRDERQQRGDATAPAPAEQFGATEQKVMPLTPPTSEKPTKKVPPGASTKQQAAEQIDSADEITPG
jgi:hypothetical protein